MNFLPIHRIELFLHESFGFGKMKSEPLRGGLLNQNLLISVSEKKFVLKVYRKEMTEEKVLRMHELMSFVSGQGIPVTLPIATKRIDGFVTAIYPFSSAEHPPRYKNSHASIRAMGDMLGRIHVVLDQYQTDVPKSTPKELMKAWEVDSSLKEILSLRENLKDVLPSMKKEINHVLDVYEKILTKEEWNSHFFSDLPIRYCHGDYHIMNILMHGSTINTVLDWEKAGWDFRSKELMRSVIYNCRKTSGELSWPLVETYLKAYRMHVSVSDLERELVFECGLRKMVFSFWAIKQYIAGHKNFRLNVLRRVAMVQGLTSHRQEYAERIAQLLS